ncbi:MAG: zinc ribbon domain-containing protein [Eggerthellaceae bacterium]|nr:zinc ribbon domain-containing protein [Eggerthellaceae bacterium]
MNCPRCGSPVPPEGRYCTECGCEVPAEGTLAPKKSPALVAGILALSLVVGGAVGFGIVNLMGSGSLGRDSHSSVGVASSSPASASTPGSPTSSRPTGSSADAKGGASSSSSSSGQSSSSSSGPESSGGGASSPKDAQPAEEAHPELHVDTSYYSIQLPESWAGQVETNVDLTEYMQEGDLGMCCTTSIRRSNGEVFNVGCFTNNWGPQGAFTSVNLGEPTDHPGWNIYVYAGVAQFEPQNQDAIVYAQYVTVKGDGHVSLPPDPEPEPQPEPAPEPESEPLPIYQGEAGEQLAIFRQRLDYLDNAWATDPQMAKSMAEMLEASSGYVQSYTDLMNEVLAFDMGRPHINPEELQASQDAWEARLEQSQAEVAAANGGGSLLGLELNGNRKDWTRSTIEELLAMND